MAELVLTPEAENDLERIYEYTYMTWGKGQANEYQDDLFHGILIILENREIGVEYSHTSGGYRKYKVNKHLVFYRNANPPFHKSFRTCFLCYFLSLKQKVSKKF